jgi:membrane protease YdiL (CAAX protease family)
VEKAPVAGTRLVEPAVLPDLPDGESASAPARTPDRAAPLPQPLPWGHLVLRHLLPGLVVMAIYVPFGSWLVAHDYPSELAFVVAFLIAGVPLELGYLLRRGKLVSGRYTLNGVVSLLQPMSRREWFIMGVLFGIIMFVPLLLLSPVADAISELMPAWMPDFLTASYDWTDASAPQWVMVGTAVLSLVLVGLVFPLVEELYFRGYLLAHAAAHGRWAPTVCAALFTVQHYWQPHNWLLILSLNLMLVHLVLAKRNLWLGYVLHAFGNTVGGVLTLLSVLES